ncbi:MAG: RHS repeat-associated core domain-containing protein [Acidobacteria bacterium]|nr:RHS repeat-associated core domain-containing protein [Acidobacteriota bacterium]
MTNASGAVTSSASYDSFGNATGNLATRYKFTGREHDDFTGFHYYRARWYDGNLGRFISEDPIGFAGGDVNLYGYVGNGPLSATDPSGLIDPSVYQDPTMYSSGGFANPAEFADGLDNGLDGVEQSIGFDPIIGYMPIPVYNEGIRIQPVTALGVARGRHAPRRSRTRTGALL